MDWLDDKDKIIEGAFAECYLKMHPMICIHGILFTIDGIVSDESGIKNDIYSMVRPYVTSRLARKVEQLLQTIKLEAYSEPLPLQTDRIHVANGTLFLNGEFSEQKDFCLNRLPVIYDPDVEKPARWLKFMEELLNPDDILTLQEYMGYMLLPTTCQTAHCGRYIPHFDFGAKPSPIVPYRHLPQSLSGMTADCRSLV